MDLQYCNGQKRYDFSTSEGFYFPGLNPRNYDIPDLSPQAFSRAYVAALYAENERWITAIEKYQMVVPGSPKNSRDKARDLTDKEKLRAQVSDDTYGDRKAFYKAWRNAPCCADDCDQYCDQCSNSGIKFKAVTTYGLDSDVRRFIFEHGRYQTASELERENDEKRTKSRNAPVLSGVRDGKGDHDPIRIGGQEGDGLFSEPAQVPSDQTERIEALLSHPISEEMVT